MICMVPSTRDSKFASEPSGALAEYSTYMPPRRSRPRDSVSGQASEFVVGSQGRILYSPRGGRLMPFAPSRPRQIVSASTTHSATIEPVRLPRFFLDFMVNHSLLLETQMDKL